jgi:hypothetical protein
MIPLTADSSQDRSQNNEEPINTKSSLVAPRPILKRAESMSASHKNSMDFGVIGGGTQAQTPMIQSRSPPTSKKTMILDKTINTRMNYGYFANRCMYHKQISPDYTLIKRQTRKLKPGVPILDIKLDALESRLYVLQKDHVSYL